MSNTTDLYTNAQQITTIHSNGGLSMPSGSTAQRPTGYMKNGTIRFNTSLGRTETWISPNWTTVIDETYGDSVYVKRIDGEVDSNLTFNDNKIINLGDPEDPKDGVNLRYLLQKLADLEGNVDAGTLDGHPIEDFVLITRNVNTGLGLIGGGSLEADLTIEMATPTLITGDTVNEATVDGHTHEITLTHDDIVEFLGYTPIDVEHVPDPTEVVSNQRQIIAGLGLVGGGNLESDVAIHVGTPSSITATSTNNSDVGTHSHQLEITKEDLEDILGTGVASSDVAITAGNGLGGGGDLTEDRLIFMKTPQSITFDTTNEANSVGHTHQLVITKANLEAIIGPILTVKNDASTNFPVGTYLTAIEYRTGSSQAGYGSICYINGMIYSRTPINGNYPGTWRTIGATGEELLGYNSSDRPNYKYYYLVQKTAN